VAEALARARRGDGPTLVEARTWRRGGHWAGDAAAYRADTADGPDDPLETLAARLIARGDVTAAGLADLRAEVQAEVAAAIARAQQSPEAGPAELGLDEVL